MTTAARPTFEPARGGQGRGEKDLSAISRQYSSRDLPGHTKLKFRYLMLYLFNDIATKLLNLNIPTGNMARAPLMKTVVAISVRSWKTVK